MSNGEGYFIMDGEISLSTPSGVEFHQMKKGEHFGDIAIIRAEKSFETAIAATKCSLLVLS